MAKSARSQYLKLIDERINDTNVLELIAWVRNLERKPAILSFTEGPARQLAYAIEATLKLERETTPVIPPLTMRPTERCPRCGFVQYVTDPPNAKVSGAGTGGEATEAEANRLRGLLVACRGSVKTDLNAYERLIATKQKHGEQETPTYIAAEAEAQRLFELLEQIDALALKTPNVQIQGAEPLAAKAPAGMPG